MNENNFEYYIVIDFKRRRETIFELKSLLMQDEKIEYMTSSSIKFGDKLSAGVLACTNKRVLFSGKIVAQIFKTFINHQIPIEKINSISTAKGFNGGINISDESNSYCFSTSNNAVPFLNAVNNVSTNLKEENLNVENNTDDIIIMKLERLAVLKEKGILSDNEFEIQKKRILEIL